MLVKAKLQLLIVKFIVAPVCSMRGLSAIALNTFLSTFKFKLLKVPNWKINNNFNNKININTLLFLSADFKPAASQTLFIHSLKKF